MKLLIVQFYLVSFFSIGSICLPQHPVFEILNLCSSQPMQNGTQNYNFEYFEINVYRQQMVRKKIMDRTVVGIPLGFI